MKKKVYSADLTHTGNGTMALTFPLGTAYVVSYAKKILEYSKSKVIALDRDKKSKIISSNIKKKFKNRFFFKNK